MPVAWADDGANRVAVVLEDRAVIRSDRAGEHWKPVVETLRVTSLAWDEAGTLYLGTDGQGVYRQAPNGTPVELTGSQAELAESRVVAMAVVEALEQYGTTVGPLPISITGTAGGGG